MKNIRSRGLPGITLSLLSAVGGCVGSRAPDGLPAADPSVTSTASTARRTPAEPQSADPFHEAVEGVPDDEAEAQGDRLATELTAKYARSPCWRADFRLFSYPSRSAGVFYKYQPNNLLLLMEGQDPAEYSLADESLFHHLFFLAKERKDNFSYRAKLFAPPVSTRSFAFSAILEAVPQREGDFPVLKVSLYLDEDLTVQGARIDHDVHGRRTEVRFVDWRPECPPSRGDVGSSGGASGARRATVEFVDVRGRAR